jgi:hypothetical protein
MDTVFVAAGITQGTSLPTGRNITLHNVRVSRGEKTASNDYDASHRTTVGLDNVHLTDVATARDRYAVNHADVMLGLGNTNLQIPASPDTNLNGTPTEATPDACIDEFASFFHAIESANRFHLAMPCCLKHPCFLSHVLAFTDPTAPPRVRLIEPMPLLGN